MRSFILFAIVTWLAAPAHAQKNCTKGKPCGNTCISRDKICRIGAGGGDYRPASGSPALGIVDASAETSEWVASSQQREFYYRASCPTAYAIPADDRIYFKTEKAAKKAGYKRSKERGC
jgi:hypothetical protein